MTQILQTFKRNDIMTKESDLILNMDFSADFKIYTAIGYKRLPELKWIDLRSSYKLKNRLWRLFDYNLPSKCDISINTFSNHPEKLQVSLFLPNLISYLSNCYLRNADFIHEKIVIDNAFFDYGELNILINTLKAKSLYLRNWVILKLLKDGPEWYFYVQTQQSPLTKLNLENINQEHLGGNCKLL